MFNTRPFTGGFGAMRIRLYHFRLVFAHGIGKLLFGKFVHAIEREAEHEELKDDELGLENPIAEPEEWVVGLHAQISFPAKEICDRF